MLQYLIHAFDGNDSKALERRMAVRPAHLEYVGELKKTGNFVLGGALLDEDEKMIGSNLIVQFEKESEFEEYLETEPYIKGKVWEKINIFRIRVANV
jgi:uncharacterized protein